MEEHHFLSGAEVERHGRRKSGRMKRRPKPAVLEENPVAPAADITAIPQVKVWLTGISPMVWRRVLVPSSFTLRAAL
jgi:hypothetical protein